MKDNPLKAPILSILNTATDKLSEHELIKQLENNHGAFQDSNQKSDLNLFRKHFMVMNALYQLQESLFKEGMHLAISALSIKLEVISDNHNGFPAEHSDAKLRAYYLDWKQLDETTESDVDALLNRFWKQYCAHVKQTDALNVLGLSNSEKWSDIQQAYRRLAARSHPDRGGDKAQFVAIREAYEILKQRNE